ncbi:MAG: hypothetical protein COA50_07910 [Flavobacteriaceae bacterium]|nr:MAG: hypothetical protein COA50_07910 [Flavobacteriaceae bacterium]
MKSIKLMTLAILVFVCQTAFAQDFEIPKNIQLEKESDYAQYEVDVLNGINWLENTPLNEQTTKRENANAFVLAWIIGTPSVTIELHTFQVDLTKKNSVLMTTFLGGWAKFALENPSEKNNNIKGNIAGFQSLMKVYAANKGKGIKKDNKVEKLLKRSPVELEAWVRKEVE